jgi:hypothetical protein
MAVLIVDIKQSFQRSRPTEKPFPCVQSIAIIDSTNHLEVAHDCLMLTPKISQSSSVLRIEGGRIATWPF